jgi:dihydrofolate synthase/folylpolyglutamate synthase
MQKIDQNITIDVGHNVLAAQAIVSEYKGKKINLIFNTFADKDAFCVLKTLKPIINQINILKINNQRIIDQKDLKNIMKTLNIRYNVFRSINSNITYLVFGSFAVAEKFIKEYYAK